MTTSTTGSYLSPMQEIIELGGTVSVSGLSREQFFNLAARYPELLMEREKNGNITIMTPVKGGSGFRENTLSYHITHWNKTFEEGLVFSPSTGFNLPDSSTKSPDVAWISSEQMQQLSPNSIEEEFISVVPDFISEIRSKTAKLVRLKEKKRQNGMENGVEMAWQIDPYKEKVHMYQ